jgi:hypothetical protein
MTLGCSASACSCGGTNHATTEWDGARIDAENSSAIFEGTLVRARALWPPITDREGELISAENPAFQHPYMPGMQLTFRVDRRYKGKLGDEVDIRTGLGGGDCGAVFLPGVRYLVYASVSSGELTTSMCSPGGFIQSQRVGTELRYLRKEKPLATDRVRRAWDGSVYPMKVTEAIRKQREEAARGYEAATGQICGRVVQSGESRGTIAFLPTIGYSPVQHSNAQVKEDGSFCSNRLGPGKYYVFFMKGSEGGLTSAAYFPGVLERSKAATIDVSPGQLANATFTVPAIKRYSVRGLISVSGDKATLPESGVYVTLLRADPNVREAWYSRPVFSKGISLLPNLAYFSFDVVPGRYMVYLSVDERGWYTNKTELTVTTHMKFVHVKLVHKN